MKVETVLWEFYDVGVPPWLQELRQNKSVERVLFYLAQRNEVNIDELGFPIFNILLYNLSPLPSFSVVLQSLVKFYFLIQKVIQITNFHKLEIFYFLNLKLHKILWLLPVNNKTKFAERVHFQSRPVIVLRVNDGPVGVLEYFWLLEKF